MLAIKEEIFDAMLPKLRARKNAANRTMLSREANMDGPALKAASAPAIASRSERSINGKMLMILALICLGSAAGLAVFFSMQKNQSAGLQNAMPSKTETLTGKNSVKPEFGEKLESKKERTFEQAHSASRSSVSDSVKSTVEIKVKTGAKQTPKAKGSPKMQAPQKAAVLSGARRTQSSAKTAASINPAAADLPPETESKSNAAGSGLSGRRRKRDWHDYSYGFEKKEDYSHSWTVPVAGSKHGE